MHFNLQLGYLVASNCIKCGFFSRLFCYFFDSVEIFLCFINFCQLQHLAMRMFSLHH